MSPVSASCQQLNSGIKPVLRFLSPKSNDKALEQLNYHVLLLGLVQEMGSRNKGREKLNFR